MMEPIAKTTNPDFKVITFKAVLAKVDAALELSSMVSKASSSGTAGPQDANSQAKRLGLDGLRSIMGAFASLENDVKVLKVMPPVVKGTIKISSLEKVLVSTKASIKSWHEAMLEDMRVSMRDLLVSLSPIAGGLTDGGSWREAQGFDAGTSDIVLAKTHYEETLGKMGKKELDTLVRLADEGLGYNKTYNECVDIVGDDDPQAAWHAQFAATVMKAQVTVMEGKVFRGVTTMRANPLKLKSFVAAQEKLAKSLTTMEKVTVWDMLMPTCRDLIERAKKMDRMP